MVGWDYLSCLIYIRITKSSCNNSLMNIIGFDDIVVYIEKSRLTISKIQLYIIVINLFKYKIRIMIWFCTPYEQILAILTINHYK